jgi:quercetin dioxygenase-like cupin family protein
MSVTRAAEVRVDGEPYLLHEGDSIRFRAHQEHSYAGRSSAPATLLVAGRPRPAL